MGVKVPEYVREFMKGLPVLDIYPDRREPTGKAPVTHKACECCGATDGVEEESSRTQYHWDGKGEDPNRNVWLCRSCAKDHHEYWDSMWAEYYSGVYPC